MLGRRTRVSPQFKRRHSTAPHPALGCTLLKCTPPICTQNGLFCFVRTHTQTVGDVVTLAPEKYLVGRHKTGGGGDGVLLHPVSLFRTPAQPSPARNLRRTGGGNADLSEMRPAGVAKNREIVPEIIPKSDNSYGCTRRHVCRGVPHGQRAPRTVVAERTASQMFYGALHVRRTERRFGPKVGSRRAPRSGRFRARRSSRLNSGTKV